MFWLMFPKLEATAESREGKLLDLERRMDEFLSSKKAKSNTGVVSAVRNQRDAVRAELASQEQWH